MDRPFDSDSHLRTSESYRDRLCFSVPHHVVKESGYHSSASTLLAGAKGLKGAQTTSLTGAVFSRPSDHLSGHMSTKIASMIDHLSDDGNRAESILWREIKQTMIVRADQQRSVSAGQPASLPSLINEVFFSLITERAQLETEERLELYLQLVRCARSLLIDVARQPDTSKPLVRMLRVLEFECAAPFVEVDGALSDLGSLDPLLLEVTELIYFAGLSVAECASLLSTNEERVRMAWRLARAKLYCELNSHAN